jgi:hypothetical protein
MTHRHISSIAVALATSAAIAAPASASGRAQDLGSPYPAYPSRQPAAANLDHRSPDAADTSRQRAVAGIDLRSPDAADPSRGAPVHVIDPAPVVSIREVDAGFDWADAGLGAGALFALALLGVGGSIVVKRRHGPALS